MAVIVSEINGNKYPVNIPSRVARYRMNCDKAWGNIVTGDTNGMNIMQAMEKGLVFGNFVEMALCWTDFKHLTFKPHYECEKFIEIWGIPVVGKMKDVWAEKASELSTFLLHRQSMDKFTVILDDIGREGFNEWVTGGMEGDPNNFTLLKVLETFSTKIFRFEMVFAKNEKGDHFWVKASYRDPVSELEFAALKTARQINEAQTKGAGYCEDSRLVENQQKALKASSAPVAEIPVANAA